MPDVPKNVRVKEVWSRTVSLVWTEPFTGNLPITKYIVQYWRYQSAPHRLHELAIPGTQTSVFIKDLSPGQAYELSVLGKCPYASPLFTYFTIPTCSMQLKTRLVEARHQTRSSLALVTKNPALLHMTSPSNQWGLRQCESPGDRRQLKTGMVKLRATTWATERRKTPACRTCTPLCLSPRRCQRVTCDRPCPPSSEISPSTSTLFVNWPKARNIQLSSRLTIQREADHSRMTF